ncbi:YcaO-like family protein [Actinoplanes oblitus]|uniref:YcaO-like family protein n=1 Tax=Actinoplanes oblitus TaxID=3040509 RepID=A0ABY8WEZ0_9ACTN|nr:YcaO-like family protein [Actinoplanes oblitus]WIM96429.1 YcaO-like family protein [Actinoplanes oblitus]
MRFRTRVPKVYGVGPHREVTTEQTFRAIAPHLGRVGITRIANITGLDRIGIPVYNAISPQSNDYLSVYNGKGATALAAKTSAIMEAVERFSAALPLRPAAIASYAELVSSSRKALDPREHTIALHHQYDIDLPISWVPSWDLLNAEEVLVPQYLAGYHTYYHEVPCYEITTTNGIASGNSLEEATCHALCELIERDDWTMAEIVSNRLSRAAETGRAGVPASREAGQYFQDMHPSIDMASLPERAGEFVRMFERAGVSLHLKDITSATGIPSVLAVVEEDISPTFSRSHKGIGTHPDAEVAVVRAIVEAAQSRVVDMQAMREDITLPDATVPHWARHTQRASRFNADAWAHRRSSRVMRFEDLPSHPSADIVEDLDLMLHRLRAQGLSQVLVVDLTAPGIPASVVRVIVPGLESWALDRSRIGQRATRHFRAAASRLEQLATPVGGQ